RPGRQPAGARLLAEEVERAVRQHLDVDCEGRPAQIDTPARRLLDESADLAFNLRRREGKAFVGPPRGDAKRLWTSIVEAGKNRRGERLQIERAPTCVRKVRDAKNPSQAVADLFPRRTRGQGTNAG